MKPLGFAILSFSLLILACQDMRKSNEKGTIVFSQSSSNEWLSKLDYQFIPLETNDSCLVSTVSDMVFDSSRLYLIDGKSNLVFAFSLSGEFISQVGDVGSGPSEYQYPVNLHIDKTKQELIVADANTPKLVYYDLKTLKYKRQLRSDDYFTNCAWLPNGDIILASGSSYVTPKRERFYAQITDENLKRKQYICPCSFDPQYRLAIGSVFYTFQDQVFLNLPFLHSVYQINETTCEETYAIELKGFQMPDQNWLKANAEENYFAALSHSDYVSAIQCQETNRYLYTTFLVGGSKDYIAFYDKEQKSSMIYSGYDFIKETSLNGLSKVITTYNDTFVATINPDVLKEKGTTIEELAQLSQSLPAESNPILCLFTFK
ncbi:MAG: 6-bladed beta-propeller [Parabacteroides sp.]|nr:6-bladed beta-propeller [Parabacteroides sp.]